MPSPDDPQDGAPAGAPPHEERQQGESRQARPGDDPIPALADALGGLLRGVLERSRTEVERIATDGRARLELRQLRKDRQVMYSKLGKEVRALLEAGEVSHPGLERGVARIQGLDERIASAERAFAARGEPVPSETETDDQEI